jgi:putative PIG3 family NAD(P)H quinone oxidoreductase
MQAVVITQPGDPEVLRLTEVPDLVPGPGEVLIDVAAAGVNRADLLQRQGLYDPPPGTSPYPGLECSGTIGQVGAGVESWREGDEVCALLAGGGYATQVVVSADQVLGVPKNVGLIEAAALPEVVCTVYSNVFMAARLAAGETFLVHGGSSGIGTVAIQMAKQAGAKVAVTAGTGEKLDACRELGADILINYRDEDFVQALKSATNGHGADVILDIMGASYLGKNVDALADDGRLVIIGMMGGAKAELNLGQLMTKRGSVTSTTLRARPAGQKAEIVAAVGENVWPIVERGTMRPVVHEILPLADAAEAHRIMAASSHIGKILLTSR